jgi:hypothetical protein
MGRATKVITGSDREADWQRRIFLDARTGLPAKNFLNFLEASKP